MNRSEPRGSLSGQRQRSVGTPRGEERRRALLMAITDDLERHGLVDFTLRRAARATNTTHKVLTYHFSDVDELMRQALHELRRRRVTRSTHDVEAVPESSLAERVRAVWEALLAESDPHRVLDQASGLAIYDPSRYARLGRDATESYLPALEAHCPSHWPPARRVDVARFILATLRGLLLDHLTSERSDSPQAGLRTLLRALQREEDDEGTS